MPASMIKESDPLYCLELPKLNDCSNESGPYLLLCWVNILVVEDQCSRLFVLVISIYYIHCVSIFVSVYQIWKCLYHANMP